MKQYEAVIKVMEENGGFATFGYLYQKALQIPGVEWKTKTPFASIRRIVQDHRFFFRIRPGLWALKKYKNKLPPSIASAQGVSKIKRDEFTHSYYQGLLVEIGNLKKYETFVPGQDKNKDFLSRKLGEIISAKEFYKFSYEHFVHLAQTIDVTWFNYRKMPAIFFEVEHLSNIQSSLLKFVELRDFYIDYFIVADSLRKREYENKVSFDAFSPIRKRVKFLSYDQLSEWHAKTCEIVILENNLKLKL